MTGAFALFLVAGAGAGLLAGLLGVGGGLVIVPTVAFLLPALGVEPAVVMHLAVGTSLASIVFTNISSAWAHHRRRAVRWREVFRLVAGIVPGALAGAWLAAFMDQDMLARVFAVFAGLMGAYLLAGRRPGPHRSVPGAAALAANGVAIGGISAIVGIGGGSLTAPLLMWCNVRAQEAVATAAACGLPLAVAGAGGFVATGWGHDLLPPGAIGFVYLPALLGIVAASVLTAPLGARIAHAVPAQALRRLFGAALLGIAFAMA